MAKKRIFGVDERGVAIEIEIEMTPEEEEEEFVKEVKKRMWFRELLKRLGLSEKQWIERMVKIRLKERLKIRLKGGL